MLDIRLVVDKTVELYLQGFSNDLYEEKIANYIKKYENIDFKTDRYMCNIHLFVPP